MINNQVEMGNSKKQIDELTKAIYISAIKKIYREDGLLTEEEYNGIIADIMRL